jgi:hypothetical protein
MSFAAGHTIFTAAAALAGGLVHRGHPGARPGGG